MMNIKEFRIVEDALRGFYIQRLFKQTKEVHFLFWLIRVEKTESWRNITAAGTKPYSSASIYRYDSSLKPFKTKQEAIDYIEKICTPNKFYYPDKFDDKGFYTVPSDKNDTIYGI